MVPRSIKLILILGVSALVVAVTYPTDNLSDRSGLPTQKLSHERQLQYVPAEAAVVLSLDFAWILEHAVHNNWFLFRSVKEPVELTQELVRLSRELVGISIVDASDAFIWYAPERRAWAGWVEGPFVTKLIPFAGENSGDARLTRLGHGLYGSMVWGGLLFGNENGVGLGLDVFDKKTPSIAAEPATHKIHKTGLKLIPDGSFVASFNFSRLGGALELPIEMVGLEGGALSFDMNGRINLLVQGWPATIKVLASKYRSRRDAHAINIGERLGRANAGYVPGWTAIATTLERYKLDELDGLFTVSDDGRHLRFRSEAHGQWFPMALAYFAGAFQGWRTQNLHQTQLNLILRNAVGTVRLFTIDGGERPGDMDDLSGYPGWTAAQGRDPWGQVLYLKTLPENRFMVYSPGPDGAEETEDDLCQKGQHQPAKAGLIPVDPHEKSTIE